MFISLLLNVNDNHSYLEKCFIISPDDFESTGKSNI